MSPLSFLMKVMKMKIMKLVVYTMQPLVMTKKHKLNFYLV